MENQQQNDNTPDGYKPASAQYFSGNAWLKTLVVSDDKTTGKGNIVKLRNGDVRKPVRLIVLISPPYSSHALPKF